MLENAKEQLRRDLRPKEKGVRVKDYEECDSPRIAKKVRELGIVDLRAAQSGSFDTFRRRVADVKW